MAAKSDPAALQYLDPREVSDYQRFAAYRPPAPVPATPPPLLPGRTSQQMFVLFIPVWFGAIVVAIGLTKVAAIPAVVLAAFAGAVLVWSFRWLRKVGNRELEEITAGYTTSLGQHGTAFMVPAPRIRKLYGPNGMVGWDYSMIWRLDSKGHVRSAPQRSDTVRPGFYPSPHRARRLELWTGKEWADIYRDDPRFYG